MERNNVIHREFFGNLTFKLYIYTYTHTHIYSFNVRLPIHTHICMYVHTCSANTKHITMDSVKGQQYA